VGFAIDVDALMERAAKRAATAANVATAANPLPEEGSKVAALATVAGSHARFGAHGVGSEPRKHGDAWTNADIDRFTARRDRLLRWHWSEREADALAERLTRRDVEGDDDRQSCADCRHLRRSSRCLNYRLAGLHSPEVGQDFVALLQRCNGYSPAVPGSTDTPSARDGASMRVAGEAPNQSAAPSTGGAC
jgi:hypothetical protein